ncbi:MAG: hypothetical protein HQL06_13095 [Nitrospirae bacterium]|nr:hypothetical protein [Nitrospirota bacterium]
MDNNNEKQTETKTIVYFDIVGYTKKDYKEQVRCVERLQEIIRNIIAGNKVVTVVEAGDAFALDFANAEDAIKFAIQLNKEVNKKADEYEVSFSIRTGIYTGQITKMKTINDTYNFFGIGIDFAQRLASCCEANQILVSSNVCVSANFTSEIKNFFTSENECEYTVKHSEKIKAYNLYSEEEVFGIQNLLLKQGASDSSLVIIIGDRRENPPSTIGDLFILSPSIDDLSHVFQMNWPPNSVLRGDKLVCWNLDSSREINDNHIFVVGSPKVNIAAFKINENSIFNFAIDDNDKKEIETFQSRFSTKEANDKSFLEWVNSEEGKKLIDKDPNNLQVVCINDTFNEGKRIYANKHRNVTYGLISFASHLNNNNKSKLSVFIAGIDLTATLTITREFFKINFSDHMFGGIIKVNYSTSDRHKPHELPHHGYLDSGSDYWYTAKYDEKAIREAKKGNTRIGELIDYLIRNKFTFENFQSFIGKYQ